MSRLGASLKCLVWRSNHPTSKYHRSGDRIWADDGQVITTTQAIAPNQACSLGERSAKELSEASARTGRFEPLRGWHFVDWRKRWPVWKQEQCERIRRRPAGGWLDK